MQNLLISASILSADFAQLGQSVQQVLALGANWVHVDVMDHHYVPNLTFGPLVVSALRHFGIDAFMDVHLMVTPVDGLIEPFAKAGAHAITFHPEATLHVHRTIQLIKSFNMKVGIALNPATPLSVLDEILNDIDLVLVMSVNPGFGGQTFIPESLEKIKRLKDKIKPYPKIQISVDGGVNEHNALSLRKSGADILVTGSALFNATDKKQFIAQLKI